MFKTKFRCAALLSTAIMFSTALALAGGKPGGEGRPLFVPDSNNNRVLIYYAPYRNGQIASGVLGQPDFASVASGETATNMNAPSAYASDAKGDLWVSDSGNCRVLKFRPPLPNGLAASQVIGQPDLTTACAASPTARTLGFTGGVAFDDSGNMWVADALNSRILRFRSPFTDGEAADLVLGQNDFVSGSCNQSPSAPSGAIPSTAATLCFPGGLAFDSDGSLWAADMGNSRVVKYSSPFKNGMRASLVVGQPNFAANAAGTSATVLALPTGIAIDGDDQLWVVDAGNNRVLRFSPRRRNAPPATLVLGQTNFLSGSPNQGFAAPTAATFYNPEGIVFDDEGRMVVGDTYNNRTLLLDHPSRNDAKATLVLGQPNFVSAAANQGGAASAATQNLPFRAGPSLLALGLLGGLVAGRSVVLHLLRRA